MSTHTELREAFQCVTAQVFFQISFFLHLIFDTVVEGELLVQLSLGVPLNFEVYLQFLPYLTRVQFFKACLAR